MGCIMIQFFNFNFDWLNKKENAYKFIFIGISLIVLGTISLIYKRLGIKIVSWTLGVCLLFLAYFNLKNINELSRYASKNEIKPYKRIQFILLISSILLFIFPSEIQGFISFIIGLYMVINQLFKISSSKNNPYFRFGLSNLMFILFGISLIVSPLLLSSFISSIISIILIIIGVNLFAKGNVLK